MGIEIYLSIFPDRIAPEAWAAVYQETLKVLDNFAFMDVVKGKYGMYFATKSRHRDDLFDGYGGWHSAGDLVTGWNTEDFYLVDNINYYRDRHYNDNGKDILLIHAQDDKELDPPSAAFVFGAKTQGMFSHIPLLAVACLVTHRFPDAALVYGNITDGQCERAVEWINSFLDEPIDIPYTADMTRLVPRLLNAGLPDNKILDRIFHTTLQAEDARMGAYLKEYLTAEQINSYFFDHLLFQRRGRETWILSFLMLKQYLEMGFDFRDLCNMVLGNHERKQDPETFLNDLLHMKLHIEIDKKNLFDVSASPDEMGDRKKVGTVSDQLFRAFAMMHGAGNKNVNAYIPLDQIKADMRSVVGEDGFDEMFDRVVSEYTGAAEGSAQAVLYDTPESKYYLDKFPQDTVNENQVSEPEEGYDITNRNWVIDYSPGMTIQPEIRKEFEDHLAVISTFADDFFPEFAAYDREKRIKWFKKALPVHILEETMDMIVAHIIDDDFIRKYVCLCLVDLNSEFTKMVVRTFLWNEVLLNDFWEIVKNRPTEPTGTAEAI